MQSCCRRFYTRNTQSRRCGCLMTGRFHSFIRSFSVKTISNFSRRALCSTCILLIRLLSETGTYVTLCVRRPPSTVLGKIMMPLDSNFVWRSTTRRHVKAQMLLAHEQTRDGYESLEAFDK
eukprot:TRINITY_DN7361_c0_g1_i2.p1 TRINITY_DN7361_c0_g1~~TRINITY_DN7361_c0_g1_i2.p1  ORF type:complete len:121 (-),score=0.50 TRINITY_DN7361_c0_g1_i2:252-614(-)